MTRKEVEVLDRGDQVFWNDPDAGKCSRYYEILEIAVAPGLGAGGNSVIVGITDVSGDRLECLAEELE